MQATVIGAGIGGLAAGLALQRAGFQVRIYEQSPELAEVGAGLSMSPNGALGLKALGVFDAFRDVAYAPDYQVIRHYKTARILGTASRGDRLTEAYGERYYLVHRVDLHRVLMQAVLSSDPDAIVPGYRFVDLEQDTDGVDLKFEGGRTVRSDFVIGADGVRSRVRSTLFGAEEVRFTGYIAWRGLVPIDRLSFDVMDPPSQIFIGPGHMINRYPVSGGRLLNFVAFAERSGWEEEGWNIPSTVAELRAEFADWHSSVTSVIDVMPEDRLFKWALCARSPLMRWVRGRVAVLGDAAHPLLPYLGQGAVMAIEDAVVLGRCFQESEDLSQALARYEAARVGRARLVVERSTMQVPRFHAADYDNFDHRVPVDEGLGLFGYDPGRVPV